MAKNISERMKKEILDNFDFEKVHKVMTLLDWRWYSSAENKVPNIEQMKNMVRSLFKSLEHPDCDAVSCGGFSLYYDTEFAEKDSVKLEFSITSYTSFLTDGD